MENTVLDLKVAGVDVRLAVLHRAGTGAPLVCLHGFGSTKEDYADLVFRPEFDERPFVFLDAPGFGASTLSDPDALSIPFLVDVALAALDALGIARFHLSGHSMGGLTGLMLARANPDRVLSFINIEGNVAPEDCFLSRQIVAHPAPTPEAFLEGFEARVRARPEYSSAVYVAGLRAKVQATSFGPVFRSMVDLSDTAPLLRYFAELPCPRVFVHGAQNRHLSYLGRLPDMGVAVEEIPLSGHFPMYANPPALWAAMARFLTAQEPPDGALAGV